MLRATVALALAAPAASFLAGSVVPKPAVDAGRAGRALMIARNRELAPVEPETPEWLTTASDLGVTALRIGTCALMVHHGLDKIQNVDGFSANVVAKFFGFLPGPPQFWTLSAAATQIVGAGLLSVGILSRPVALSMSITMVV